MDLQEQISAIGLTDTEPTPAEPVTPEEQPVVTPEVVPAAEPDLNEEIQMLKRVVARDPNLRQVYMAEKLGIEFEPQPVTQPLPQAPQQELPPQPYQVPQVQLPFAPEEYDATNIEHQHALISHTVVPILGQMLAPFAQFIQETKQENLQYQQQVAQNETGQLDQELNQFTDTLIPGFSTLWAKPNLTLEEQTVQDQAAKLFKKELLAYPEKTRRHPKVLQEVVKTIAPQVKSLADRFGIFQAPLPEGQTAPAPQRPPGAYVEPANNAPTVMQKNKFDAAYEKKDIKGMISAIGRTV